MLHSKDEKPACSTANAAVPDEVVCDNCGEHVEMWSDEKSVACDGCGHEVTRE